MSPLYTHIRESGGTGAIPECHNDSTLSLHACIEKCVPLYLWSIISLPLGLQLPRWVRELKLCAAADLARSDGKRRVQTNRACELGSKAGLERWVNEPGYMCTGLLMPRGQSLINLKTTLRSSRPLVLFKASINPGIWGNVRWCHVLSALAALHYQDQSSLPGPHPSTRNPSKKAPLPNARERLPPFWSIFNHYFSKYCQS